MSENVLDFQSQLVAIMEILVKAVVCETTKLFETGVLQLRVEIANIKKENEELRSRLGSAEGGRLERLHLAQKCQETCVLITKNCSPKPYGGTTVPTREEDASSTKEELLAVESVLIKQEESDTEECMSESSVVSKEIPKEASVNQNSSNGTSVNKPLLDASDDAGGALESGGGGAETAMEQDVDKWSVWDIHRSRLRNRQALHMASQAKSKHAEGQHDNQVVECGTERNGDFWTVCRNQDGHMDIEEQQHKWTNDRESQYATYPEDGMGCMVFGRLSGAEEVSVDFIRAGGTAELPAMQDAEAAAVESDVAQPEPDNSHSHRDVNEHLRPPLVRETSVREMLNHSSWDRRQIQPERSPWQCTLCGRVLSSATALEAHRSVHTGERPYSCSQCGKAFPSLRGLNRHAQVHSNERQHQCLQCGKRFVYQFSLRKHQLIHSGERTHACQHCDKTFMFKSDLTIHLRKHTGETPYGCGICGKNFKHRRTLNTHLQGHSGEKRHICTHCGKSFLDLGNFKRHKRIHTGEKPYSCQLCGKSFTQSAHLKKHYFTHR